MTVAWSVVSSHLRKDFCFIWFLWSLFNFCLMWWRYMSLQFFYKFFTLKNANWLLAYFGRNGVMLLYTCFTSICYRCVKFLSKLLKNVLYICFSSLLQFFYSLEFSILEKREKNFLFAVFFYKNCWSWTIFLQLL